MEEKKKVKGSMNSRKSMDAKNIVNEITKYKKELYDILEEDSVGETKSISELSKEDYELLNNLVADVERDVKNFFGVTENVPTPDIEILTGSDYAHFDTSKKKLRINKYVLEAYKKEPEKIKSTLAEELTHALRDYMNLSDSVAVEEFFGHLAKLNEGDKPGIGKIIMDRYKTQRDGKWYSPEKVEEVCEGLKEKLDHIGELKNKGNMDEVREYLKKFETELNILKDNLSFQFTIAEPIKYGKKVISNQTPFDRIISYFNDLMDDKVSSDWVVDNMKDNLDDISKYVELLHDVTNPYKDIHPYMGSGKKHYSKYLSYKVHARGYSTAEEMFDSIESGKIDPHDLFYKDAKTIDKYLLDGKKTDSLKKIGYKGYAEIKNVERELKDLYPGKEHLKETYSKTKKSVNDYLKKLKKYLPVLIILSCSVLILSELNSSATGYFTQAQATPFGYGFIASIIIFIILFEKRLSAKFKK